MILSRLERRDRRAIIAGGVVLLPALLFIFVVRPFAAELADARDRLDRERDMLRREIGLLADAEAFPEAIAARVEVLEQEARRLFAGPDPLAATAALERYVIEQAAASRVFVQRSETLGVLDRGDGITTLRTALRALGDLDGVLHFLDALESGPQLVSVERVALERTVRPGGEDRDEVLIAVSLTISGYSLTEPPGALEEGGER